MQKIVVFTLLLAVFTVSLSSSAADYNDRVYAVVEDEVITLHDVRRQTALMERQLMNQMSGVEAETQAGKLRRQAAERMIHNELCYAEFKERELDVPKDYVEDRIDNIVRSEAGGSYDKFEEMLEDDGMEMEEFREFLKKQIASQLLLEQFVSQRVKVTPEEVETYFQENTDEFAEDGRLKLAIIFLAANDDESLAERVDVVEESLADGEDFSGLAKEYSDEERSAARGGELGWLDSNECRTVFREAVEGLQPGEVSEPVEVEKGVFLVKLLDREEGDDAELTAEIREEIREKLRQERQNDFYGELIEKLENKFYVKRYFKS